MRIIITGATGSLGAYMVRHFSTFGHDILSTSRVDSPPASLKRFSTYHQADITRPFDLPEADIIIHTAALSDDKGKPKDLFETNVIGTENVVKAAKHIPVFIHISSSSVYLPSETPIPEELAGKQNNRQLSPYGYSKLQSEQKLKEVLTQESCCILRPRVLYGPGDKVIMPRMLKLVNKQILTCPGKMEIDISMTHYRNLARAIEAYMLEPSTGIHTYNVADEEVYQLIDIMRLLTTELYGKPLPEKRIPIALMKFLATFRLGGVTPLLVRAFTKSMVLDLSKIKRERNYQAVETYQTTLKETGDWVRSIGGVDAIMKADKELAWR